MDVNTLPDELAAELAKLAVHAAYSQETYDKSHADGRQVAAAAFENGRWQTGELELSADH